jgi:hypothetical protein
MSQLVVISVNAGNSLMGGFTAPALSGLALSCPIAQAIATELGMQKGDAALARTDPRLIEAVRRLDPGRQEYAVIEIPDDVAWYVSDYDGYEQVVECSRRWAASGRCWTPAVGSTVDHPVTLRAPQRRPRADRVSRGDGGSHTL